MLLSFLYGLIGIVLLVAFCLIGAFLVPQNAYWFMTPKAKELLEKYGIPRELKLKDKIIIGSLALIVGAGFIVTIIIAGKQGVASGMTFWQLALRFVIFFGVLIEKKTGKKPDVRRVEPQWDGKEIHKLVIEVVVSAILAWIFIKVG